MMQGDYFFYMHNGLYWICVVKTSLSFCCFCKNATKVWQIHKVGGFSCFNFFRK